MSRIVVISATGNPGGDQIFRGVFGAINDVGQFEIDSELRKIYLMSLVTPAGLAEQGIDLAHATEQVEIDDAALPAFKATVMSGLNRRWIENYARQPAGNGVTKAALDADQKMTTRVIEEAIKSMGMTPVTAQVSREFVNIETSQLFADDDSDGDTFDQADDFAEPIGVQISASRVVGSTGSVWAVNAVEVDVAGGVEVAKIDQQAGYASGVVLSSIQVYGAPEHHDAVVSAINSLSAGLARHLAPVATPLITQIEWHQEPKEISTQTFAQVAGSATHPDQPVDDVQSDAPTI